jgi:septum formation protein
VQLYYGFCVSTGLIHNVFSNLQPLILASASPRRSGLLQSLGIQFTLCVTQTDETIELNEKPNDYVRRMAEAKAANAACLNPSDWILSADTIVVCEDRIFGKPADSSEALEMLLQLSGMKHKVLTAFTLQNQTCGVVETSLETAYVTMLESNILLLKAYVASGEPLDKAGAYAVQGLGGVLIKKIEGAYSTIVGLPVHRVVAALLSYEVIEAVVRR